MKHVTALFACALLAGCDAQPTKPTKPEQKQSTAAKSSDKSKDSRPMKYIPPPIEKKPSTKSRDEAFRDAWEDAKRAGRQLDDDEPAASEKAKKILTNPELIQVERALFNPSLYLDRHAPTLTRLGLTERLARESRKIALDEEENFGATARVLWEQESGFDGILRMMNVWGTIPRGTRHIVTVSVSSNAVTTRLTPDVRDAILSLGGRKWLER